LLIFGPLVLIVGAAFAAGAIRNSDGVLWEAGMETGDLSQWSGFSPTGNAHAEISNQQAHTGHYSLALHADAGNGVAGIRARFEERIYSDPHNLPTDAYYSVWLYIPQPLNPVNNIFQWKQAVLNVPENRDRGQTRRLLYFIRADWIAEDQNMRLVLRGKVDPDEGSWPSKANYTLAESGDLRLRLDTWHHLEARYLWDASGNGLIEIWLDGVKWAGSTGLYTELSAEYIRKPRQWTVNNYMTRGNGAWDPEVSVIYVDDAAISNKRLGQ
jgi:hypothetical protein